MKDVKLIPDWMIESDTEGENAPQMARPYKSGYVVRRTSNGGVAVRFTSKDYKNGAFIKTVKATGTTNVKEVEVLVMKPGTLSFTSEGIYPAETSIPIGDSVRALLVRPVSPTDENDQFYVFHILVNGCFHFISKFVTCSLQH